MVAKSQRPKKATVGAFVRKIIEELNFRDAGLRQTFVVGIDALQEVLRKLSSQNNKWWIKKETANSVILGHLGPQDAEPPQVAPFLISLAKVDEDTVCLFTTQGVVQRGQYLRHGKRVHDEAEDDERFWVPLKRGIWRQHRRQFERTQKRALQMIKTRPLPTWKDCLIRDSGKRSAKTDAQMLGRLMSSDEVDYSPDRVLANEEKRIADVLPFTERFRELLQEGCKAGTLAQTVGYFQSYLTAREKHERHRYRFPSRPKLRKLASTLRESADELEGLQFWYDPPNAVIDKGMVSRMRKAREEMTGESMPAGWDETDALYNLAGFMEVYASILEVWEPPRSDSIRAYGVIAPCVYAEVATGKPHYRLVAELLSAYSGEKIDEVFDENQISKRVRYFRASFPEAHKLLRSRLDEQHQHQPYYPQTDYESLLDALEKSK